MNSSASIDLELMRASTLLDSNPADAARRAGDILAASPGHSEANLLLAAACRRLGDGAAAAGVLESLASANPSSAVLQLELGRAYATSGRGADAVQAFERALDLDAGLADAWEGLAAQRFAAGDALGGDAAYASFRRLSSQPPDLKDASVALGEGRLDAAEAMLQQRLQRAPLDVFARRMLAEVAMRRDDYIEAENQLRECLAIAPGDSQARYDLGRALYEQHKNAEVLPLVDRLLAGSPHNADYLHLKARALRLINRDAEAIALMEAAVAASPGDDRAWLLRGHLLRETGQQARAIESYRRALAVRPESGAAYDSLGNLKTFRFDDADFETMHAQLAKSSVRGSDRLHLEFALGQALEHKGDYAASFEHYARANALHRATIVYDAQATSDDVRRTEALLTPEFFAARAGFGSARPDPIFIVGLPRSGSTLLEQILSSHSTVEGAGELTDLAAVARDLVLQPGVAGRSAYPDSIAPLDAAALEALAMRYLERAAAHRPLGKPRFVDKMLFNFGHLGLIHLMFPNASIIDARRHPLGCGLSCFKQRFSRSLSFTYDLGELGRYYRDYAQLMEHFDTVLPGRVHRVYYEQLIAHPEREVRALLDYCRLPFEAECLRFYDNPRIVRTISSEQVRQPLYTESVDRWRHYEPWLGPLKDAVGDLIERHPAG